MYPKRLVLAAIAALSLVAAPSAVAHSDPVQMSSPTTAVAAAPDLTGYHLAFADEFSGTTVDTAKWNFRRDTKGLSAQRPGNVTIGGGLMTINLLKESYDGMAYTGGGLVSKRAFRYGYYETRARTNVGNGWHSSFWAAAGDGLNFGSGNRTEIDAFEVDSHVPRLSRHNAIAWTATGSATTVSSGIYDVGFNTSSDWHVYGFDWQEDTVKFYIDDVLKYTANYPTTSGYHNYINVWLTAIAAKINNSPGVDESALPGAVSFDYFHYFERDYYGDNDAPSGYSESGTSWSNSSVRAFAGMTSRFSCASDAVANWTVTPNQSGNYRAYFYRLGGDGGEPAAPLRLSRGTTVLATTTVNLATPDSEWTPIGTYSMTAGTAHTFRLSSAGAGCIRADAVKLVRVL